MIDKLTQLTKNEKVKKGIEKIKSIPKKYFYIALSVLLVLIIGMSIITAVAKNELTQIAVEALPNSLITFIENNNPVYVTKDVQLLQEFTHNDKTYPIKWKSNNTKVIDNTGVVTRPNEKNAEVTLTASIKKGTASIEFPYELTVICGDIINATEMQSLTAEAIMTDNALTGVKFDTNSLVINTDIDAALFAEYYINRLNNNSNIKVSFVHALPSLTGKVFIFKQANQGVKINDTFVNVFVNEKGNPIEISLHLETKEITNDTELVSEKDVISAFMTYENLDAKNIYSIEEGYVDGIKVYKVLFCTNEYEYNALYLTNEHIQEYKQKDAKDIDIKNNPTILYQRELQAYNPITPNIARGINIYTNAELDDALYTQISDNLQTTYNWYLDNLGWWSIDNKGANVQAVCDKAIETNITGYAFPQPLFFFNHTDGHTKHMGACLDIVAHEYTHAVCHYIVGSIDKKTPEVFSITESYADVFACLIDGDWAMAEGSYVNGTDMRNIKDCTYKYRDENWSDTNNHKNGMILSKTAYLMSQKGIDNIDVAKIWYHSMFYGYHNESTFKDVQNNLIRAATALDYSAKTIEIINESFQEIGL